MSEENWKIWWGRGRRRRGRRSFCFTVPARAHSFFLVEEPGKIQRIRKTDGMSDSADGKIRGTQQDACLPETVIQQIALQGHTGGGFEDPVEVRAVQHQMIRNILHSDRIAVRTFDIA